VNAANTAQPMTRRLPFRAENLRELGLLLIIVVIMGIFGSQVPNFFSATTFQRISDLVMIIAVVAVGQTLVVLTRNLDLSVGSVVGLTAFVVGKQFAGNVNLSPVLAIGLSLSIGAMTGLINGLIVAYGRVPAIVATLGTLAIYRGVLFQVANQSNIATRQLPEWVVNLPSQTLLSIGTINITMMVGLALLVVIVFQLVLIYLPSGRRLYAIGSDPETARTSGIPARRLILFAYVVCGILAGLGGLMYLAKIGTITSVAAQGLELETVAAVVLGGINIFGGSGRMIGALLGAILVATLEYGLIRMQISEFWKQAVEGLAILLAVASDVVLIARLREALAKRQARALMASVPQMTSAPRQN
jgi:rhamnose transport system permease protein